MIRPRLSMSGWRLTGGLVFATILTVFVIQAATLFSRAMERTVVYKYFDDALIKVPDTLQSVNWDAPVRALDRDFPVQDQVVVGRLLSEAWQAYSNATSSGVTDFLADGFSGPALTRAKIAAATPGMRMITLHQDVRPAFFHMDGSLLQIQSNSLTARFALDAAGPDTPLSAYRVTEDATISTLVNEAQGWRIFSHEMRASNDLPLPAPLAKPMPKLAGINYYPANSPWTEFWPGFDRTVIAKDFELIRSLNANAIRIFLQRKAFLDPEQAPQNLRNLKILLSEADKAGLYVVPTLFDMRPDFGPGTWANDYLWLQAVLPVLATAPNVIYVDLKNEPDLDYAVYGQGLVDAWLMTMAASARQIEPGLKLTIGWQRAQPALRLINIVDVVTYHDYGDIDLTTDRLAMVRKAAGDKPVQITEIGASSWSALFGFWPHSPASQAETLGTRLAGLASADGVFIWTLHDFPKPDAKAIGRSPWRKGLQGHFGMINALGAEKPAAAIVRSAFETLLKDTSP